LKMDRRAWVVILLLCIVSFILYLTWNILPVNWEFYYFVRPEGGWTDFFTPVVTILIFIYFILVRDKFKTQHTSV
jgi:hypothetical protein